MPREEGSIIQNQASTGLRIDRLTQAEGEAYGHALGFMVHVRIWSRSVNLMGTVGWVK